MSDTCSCHKRYDQDHDWWRCDVHGKVTKTDYEDEYDVGEKKEPTTKKPRPAAKPPVKKSRPTPPTKKSRDADDEDDGDDDEDDLHAPPDKEPAPKDGDTGAASKPKGFGWGE